MDRKLSSKKRRALVDRRLLKYSAAAGAAMAAGQQADAAVEARLNQNVRILPGQQFELDLDNDGTPDVRFVLNTVFNQDSGYNNPPFQNTEYRGTVYSYGPADDPYGYDPGDYVRIGGMRTRVYTRSSSSSRRFSFSGGGYVYNAGYGARIATSGFARKFDGSSLISVLKFDSGAASSASLATLTENSYYRRSYQKQTYLKQYLSANGAVTNSVTHPSYYSFTNSNPSFRMYGTGDGEFLGQRGFLGVEFRNSSGGVHNAWVDLGLELGQQSGSTLTLHGWGYETVEGVGINAGSTESLIPEPSGLAALATGAVGVMALRRNRRKKAVEAKKAE